VPPGGRQSHNRLRGAARYSGVHTLRPDLELKPNACLRARWTAGKAGRGASFIARILGTVLLVPGCTHSYRFAKSQSNAAMPPHVDTSLARYLRSHAAPDSVACFDKACAVELFLPRPEQVASLKRSLGDGAFIALDDAGWYSKNARQTLEDYGTPVFLPLADNVRFKGAKTWTIAIDDLRDQSAYLLFDPKRGLKLIPAVDIDRATLDTFFAP